MRTKGFHFILLMISTSLSTLVAQNNFKLIDSLILAKKYAEAEIVLDTENSNRNDKEYLERLGDVLSYQAKWEEASEIYNQLLECYTNSANFYYKYGGSLAMTAKSSNKLKALALLGDIKDAFNKSLEIDPNHINAHWALIELYLELPGLLGGSDERALSYAINLEKISQVDGFLAKGYVYESTEDYEKAEFFFKQAVEVGGSELCFSKLQSYYEKSDQPHKAIETVELSRSKYDRNVMHYQIGRICATNNIYLTKGKHCLETYIANYTSVDNVPLEWAYFRLSQIMELQGLTAQELNYLNKALQINPTFSDALKRRQSIKLD